LLPNGQIGMFEETEEFAAAEIPKKKVKEHTRAPKRKMEEIYGNLPTEEPEIHYLTDEEKTCKRCGGHMCVIGFDTHTEIKHIPAVYKVREIRLEKCVCKCCEGKMDEDGEEHPVFAVAEGPRALIRGSMISPSLAAHEINAKLNLRLPLYCLGQEYARNGLCRSRQTMSNNMLALGGMLEPLYERMKKELVRMEIIHADETPWQVNHGNGKEGPVRGYFWVYTSGKYEPKQIVLYDYENGRGAEYPKKFLRGFSGYGHCDGLGQYSAVRGFTRVGCFAHLWRYFLNAVKVQSDRNDYTTAAGVGLLMIDEIFKAERKDPEKPREASPLSLEEIGEIRKTATKALLEKFFGWCAEKERENLPSAKTREAIQYALNQKEALSRILEDPRLELTNNAAEHAVRPVAVGRKNWLFSDRERGARALSVLFSIVETAKANALKPYEYLKHIFETMRGGKNIEWPELLPWSGKIPESVRI
ncbi:MAG: IS66 family transposase, partial [Clostridia bacterium]|nr:IS66 family transposase [Clostridia bacterium]